MIILLIIYFLLSLFVNLHHGENLAKVSNKIQNIRFFYDINNLGQSKNYFNAGDIPLSKK